MPRVEIGVGPDRFADTVRAVSIMAGFQRLSKLPIHTAVVDLQQAIDGDSPAVLVATLELEIPNAVPNQPNYRLYRVNEPVPRP